MSDTNSPVDQGNEEFYSNQEELKDSGQVVTAPEPRGAEPEQNRLVQMPRGVGGRGGPPAPGGAGKSRSWGGAVPPGRWYGAEFDARGVAEGPVLDSLKNNRNKFCGRHTVNGPVNTEAGERWRYSSLKCGCWSCGRCGPKKLKRFKAAIIREAEENGNLTRFLTLTLAHPDIGFCELRRWIRYLRSCWNKFRVYLKRKYRDPVSFICVLELRSKSNRLHPHLHLLIDRFIPQRWISEAWQAVGGGKIVVIKYVDVHRVSGYLSKYVTKEMLTSEFPSYVRRFTTSRDIQLFEKRNKGLWGLVRIPIAQIYLRVRVSAQNVRHDEENNQVEAFDLLAPIGWEVVCASP